MIICSCNGLSDRDVHAAIQAGVVKISEIYSARQCRVKCGNCVKGVACMLKEARQKNCACPNNAAALEQEMPLQIIGSDEMAQKKEASL